MADRELNNPDPAKNLLDQSMVAFGKGIIDSLRIAWPWQLLLLAVGLATGVVLVLSGNESLSDTQIDRISSLVMAPIALLGAASMAVSWHRSVLIQEKQNRFLTLRFDGRVLRYSLALLLFVVVAVLLILGVAGVLIAATRFFGEINRYVFLGAILLALAAATYLGLRVSPTAVSIAVGPRTLSVSQSWNLTGGYGFRLFLMFIGLSLVSGLLTLPFVLLRVMLNKTGIDEISLLGETLQEIVRNWLWTFISLSFLSVVYRAFVTERLGSGLPDGTTIPNEMQPSPPA